MAAPSLLNIPVGTGRASTPDNPAVDVLGDIDVRVYVALADWTPAANQTLVSKLDTVGNQRSWQVNVNTTGNLGFQGSPDGLASPSAFSTATIPSLGIADGAAVWLRATADIDNGASGRTISFYWSTDGTTWTPIGNPVIVSGAWAGLFNSSAPLVVGAQATGGGSLVGKVYAVEVRKGIGGQIVTNPNFRTVAAGATSFPDTMGRQWSVITPATIITDPTWVETWRIVTDPYLHRVNVAVFNLGTTAVSIERIMPGGRIEKVRNAQSVTPIGGTLIFDDFDAPTDTPFQYRVVGTANISEQVILESLGMFFLADPNLPSQAIRVIPAANAIPSWKRDAPVGIHRVLGRPDPVVVTDTRWWASGDMTLYTLTNNQREEVGNMTSMGITLALYGPAEVLGGVGRVYFVAPTVDERRVSARGTQTEREWHLEITQVAQPSTVPVTPPFVTWQDVVESYVTWQDVVDHELDWLDVMRDVPTTVRAPDVGWEW